VQRPGQEQGKGKQAIFSEPFLTRKIHFKKKLLEINILRAENFTEKNRW